MKHLIILTIFIVLLCEHSVIGGGKKQYKGKYSAEANDARNTNEIKPKKNKEPKRTDDSNEIDSRKMLNSNELPAEKYDPDFRTLQKPFRMAKLNLVWVKAQQVNFSSIVHII